MRLCHGAQQAPIPQLLPILQLQLIFVTIIAQSLGAKNDTCMQSSSLNTTNDYMTIMRQVKNIELRDGGGGGGGATYIFTVSLVRVTHARLHVYYYYI